MSSMSLNMKDLSDSISDKMTNPYVKAAVVASLALFAAHMAHRLPPKLHRLFRNPWIVLMFVAGIAYLAVKDTTIAIVAAFVVIFTYNTLSCNSIKSQIGSYWKGIPYSEDLGEDLGNAFDFADRPFVPAQRWIKDGVTYVKDKLTGEMVAIENDYENFQASDVVEEDPYPVEGAKIAIETSGDEGLYVDPPGYGGCGLYEDLTKRASIGSGAVAGYDQSAAQYQFE